LQWHYSILLNAYGNIEEDICNSIQRMDNMRKLVNGNNALIIPKEKRLQIISQNTAHISIVMLCSSSVMDEKGNSFSIKGPYNFNCKEWLTTLDYMESHMIQGHMDNGDFGKYCFCRNYCKATTTCTLKEHF
jgi:hypothetical protein